MAKDVDNRKLVGYFYFKYHAIIFFIANNTKIKHANFMSPLLNSAIK